MSEVKPSGILGVFIQYQLEETRKREKFLLMIQNAVEDGRDHLVPEDWDDIDKDSQRILHEMGVIK